MNYRSNSNKFFLCKVATQEMQENGLEKKVVRTYAIEALTWSEAEARITEELAPYGEFEIKDIRPASYSEVFICESPNHNVLWYSVKLEFITIEEHTGKEKHIAHSILFPSESLDSANKNVDVIMRESMLIYEKKEIKGSNIFDVIEYQKA